MFVSCIVSQDNQINVCTQVATNNSEGQRLVELSVILDILLTLITLQGLILH